MSKLKLKVGEMYKTKNGKKAFCFMVERFHLVYDGILYRCAIPEMGTTYYLQNGLKAFNSKDTKCPYHIISKWDKNDNKRRG